MEKYKITTLAELAKKLGCNKSRLHYYQKIGVLSPIGVVAKAAIFGEKEATAIVKKIDSLRDRGFSIKEAIIMIKELIKNESNKQRKLNKVFGQPAGHKLANSRNK
jgi:DNA-binding transcriptional MerR regulator